MLIGLEHAVAKVEESLGAREGLGDVGYGIWKWEGGPRDVGNILPVPASGSLAHRTPVDALKPPRQEH